MKWTKGQRVDSPAKAVRQLRCVVCKGEIVRDEDYISSGTPNDRGEIEYTVSAHPDCISLLVASQRSRAAA